MGTTSTPSAPDSPDIEGTEDIGGEGKPSFEELMRAVLSEEQLQRLTTTGRAA